MDIIKRTLAEEELSVIVAKEFSQEAVLSSLQRFIAESNLLVKLSRGGSDVQEYADDIGTISASLDLVAEGSMFWINIELSATRPSEQYH